MSDFSYKPTLHGERVRLEPLTEAHFDAMWPILNDDEELKRLTGSHAEVSEEHLRKWMATRAGVDGRLDLAVIDVESGACVGEAVLNDWESEDRSCNFRIAIGAAGRDRGLGSEAVRLIVGYGFEKLGLHRISLGVFAFNPRAQRAYEKVGFVREGVLRETLFWDGEWQDEIVMAILEHEWERHRGRP